MPYANIISGIYTITCSVNNKHYVGQSVNCLHRLNQHKNALLQNRHHSFHLQRAFNKYGKDKFSFAILETYDKEFLLSMEGYWVNMLNCGTRKYGYNIDIPRTNGKHSLSDFTKINHSRTGIKRVTSEEVKQKLRKANLGKILSEEGLNKLQKGGVVYRTTEKYKNDMIRIRKNRGVVTILYDLLSHKWKRFDTQLDAGFYLTGKEVSRVNTAMNEPTKSVKNHLVFSEDTFDKTKVYNKQKRKNNGKRSKEYKTLMGKI